MDLRFKHMGVAVPDLAKAVPIYRDLFGCEPTSGPFDDPIQKVSVCFLGPTESLPVQIELVAPLNEESPVRKILAKGGGAYHLCYGTADLDRTLAELAVKGCVTVSAPVPAVAFSGRRIAWLFTPTRQLLELGEE